MISTIAFSTEAELEQVCAQENSAVQEVSYATAPMAAILPAYQALSEEELHASFEEALSDRLVAVQSKLERLRSASQPVVAYAETGPLAHSVFCMRALATVKSPVRSQKGLPFSWRKIVLYTSLALIFVLLGFDLMGLLMLHVR